MRLPLEPGATVEPGRYTALVGPPRHLLDLLALPEVDRYTALYLYGVGSRILGRLPRRAPRLDLRSCMTVYQFLDSVREAHQTLLVLEYDDGVLSGLEGVDREAVFALGRALREARASAAVLLWAPRADRGVTALLRAADEVVWHYDEAPPAPRRRRRSVQATLGDPGNGPGARGKA